MAKFREKSFAIPLLAALGGGSTMMGAVNASMIGGTVASLKQGSDQMKQNEEMAAKQEEQNREMTKALNKIAKNAAKNPVAAQQASQVLQGRQFSFTKNLVGLAKDVKKAAWTPGAKKWMKIGLASGAVMGGTGYLVDKGIQRDAKKIGMMPNNQQPQQLEQKSYAAVGSVLSKAGKFVKNNKMELGMSAAFSTLALPGYLSERKQFLDQKKATTMSQPQQRSYAFIPKMSGIKKAFQPLRDHWGQTVLGGMNKLVSFGGIGRKEVAGFGKRMAEGSSSSWGKKLGTFIQNNPKTALTGSLGVSAAAAAGSYGLGERVVKKGVEKVDKNAFAYEKSKNQAVQ